MIVYRFSVIKLLNGVICQQRLLSLLLVSHPQRIEHLIKFRRVLAHLKRLFQILRADELLQVNRVATIIEDRESFTTRCLQSLTARLRREYMSKSFAWTGQFQSTLRLHDRTF
jgi:hypothetical protein